MSVNPIISSRITTNDIYKRYKKVTGHLHITGLIRSRDVEVRKGTADSRGVFVHAFLPSSFRQPIVIPLHSL